MTILLNNQEKKWGILYALFEFFLLPQVASVIMYAFSLPEWLINICFFSVNFICWIWIFRKFFSASCKHALSQPKKVISYTLIGVPLYYISLIILGVFILRICPDFQNLNNASIAQMTKENRLWMTIGTVLLVPTAEEAFFRGLLFCGVYPKNTVIAYGLSAGLFSAVHILSYAGIYTPIMFLLAFLQYLPAGFILAFSYQKSGTILTPIAIHTCINLIGLCLM